MNFRRVLALAFAGSLLIMPSLTFGHRSTLTIRPAFLPVPNTENTESDPALFKLAPPNVVLHEFILLPGWVKKTQFEALCQWLTAQGFTLVRVNRPEPWRTYPDVRFRGTVAQFNQAFHVTVMERFAGHRCYAVFTSLLMPVRFAPKGEDYVEAYSFGADASSGLTTTCYWDSSLIG